MLADRLARYTQSLRYDDLQAEVVHEVKRRILDSLGCALGAWMRGLVALRANWLSRFDSVPAPRFGVPVTKRCRTLPRSPTVRSCGIWISTIRTSPRNQRILRTIFRRLWPQERSFGHRARQAIQAITLAYEIHCRLCDGRRYGLVGGIM